MAGGRAGRLAGWRAGRQKRDRGVQAAKEAAQCSAGRRDRTGEAGSVNAGQGAGRAGKQGK